MGSVFVLGVIVGIAGFAAADHYGLTSLFLAAPVVPSAGTSRLGSRHASPIALERREVLTGGGAAAIATLFGFPRSARAASDGGKWAQRFEAFTDADFAGMTKTPSGLEYKVVEEGPETNVKPKAGQRIKANYAGYLLNGAKFDASYDRNQPLEFAVGVGQVIKGWDEALLDMRVGEKRLLRIPSNLAYGSKGAGGVIPPDATLVFFVELVTITGR